jgi:hypothetical protein
MLPSPFPRPLGTRILILNPALNQSQLKAAFAPQGRLQIDRFLLLEAAEAFHTCLATEIPWEVAYQNGETSASVSNATFDAMSPPERAALVQFIQNAAQD